MTAPKEPNKIHWLEYIFGCFHKWETIGVATINNRYGDEGCVGKLYTQCCKKCGSIKGNKIGLIS